MATAKEETNKTKVLVNVYEPLVTIMKHKMDAACLKRDAYLDKALRCEAELLREEITTPNSERAKTYIADNLKQLRLKPLNLLLSQETVELINDVCKEKNIPRDAFINRFCLLLIASDTVLATLFSHEASVTGLEYGLDGICGGDLLDFFEHDNILDSIEDLLNNSSPFFRLRHAIFDDSPKLYRSAFKKNALNTLPNEYAFLKTDNSLGFNTFMADDEVFEQEALDKTINAKVEVDKLLAFAKKEKKARPAKTKPIGEAQ